MIIRAVVFDVGGVLERIDDTEAWLERATSLAAFASVAGWVLDLFDLFDLKQSTSPCRR